MIYYTIRSSEIHGLYIRWEHFTVSSLHASFLPEALQALLAEVYVSGTYEGSGRTSSRPVPMTSQASPYPQFLGGLRSGFWDKFAGLSLAGEKADRGTVLRNTRDGR